MNETCLRAMYLYNIKNVNSLYYELVHCFNLQKIKKNDCIFHRFFLEYECIVVLSERYCIELIILEF